MEASIVIKKADSYEEFKEQMLSDFGYKLREVVSREYGVYLSLTGCPHCRLHLLCGYFFALTRHADAIMLDSNNIIFIIKL